MDKKTHNALRRVLDYVERWNKQDIGREVLDAVQQLEAWMDEVSKDFNSTVLPSSSEVSETG